MNHELLDVKLDLEKEEEPEIKLQTSAGSQINKAREFQKNIYFCFIDYAKAFNSVDHNILWTILQEMGMPDYLTCLLRNLYADQEAAIRTGHETTNSFQIGKGVCRAVYCHPAHLTSMRNTGWMEHRLESRLLGEISITSGMEMTPSYGRK